MEIPYPSLIFFRLNVLQMSLTKDFRSFAKLWLPQNSISDDIGEKFPLLFFSLEYRVFSFHFAAPNWMIKRPLLALFFAFAVLEVNMGTKA